MKHLILTILLTAAAWAQTGPEVPCTGCDLINQKITTPYYQGAHFERFFLPESGHWYNPEQPGTGVTLEVQQDTVAGYYFGYKEDGSQAWYQFAGQLELLANEQGRWRLQVPLYEYSNGQCIGCDYQPPAEPVERHQLTLIFQQRSLASMQIDELPAVNIQPIAYGLESINLFPDFTEFRTAAPDTTASNDPFRFSGTWVFGFIVDAGNFLTTRAFSARLETTTPSEDSNVVYQVMLFWSVDDGTHYVLGQIQCYKDSPWPESTGEGPVCALFTHPDVALRHYARLEGPTELTFVFPYADIASGRMSGFSLERNNYLFTAYRLYHD